MILSKAKECKGRYYFAQGCVLLPSSGNVQGWALCHYFVVVMIVPRANIIYTDSIENGIILLKGIHYYLRAEL